ncbi:ral guanine nucleotide dissociation stimulator-like 1 isoform X1 [Triplophysa dalaica]|uniref:ral guanine nucleotide dissociation stimulator-like 1 isoform X1 n=1 Tax=Triplophysa dalaica TaxID=1582913 RepID=UPI0024DFCC08|nr:ral guanine nucleotide dissociation stimulator-like 1 isoform X1 [Triplophysa dalaica]XP_056607363.1 ral guanine nucleotide dissociation stimulator-like 1 isoform X1 [Triplophysa dalaica]
MRSSLVVSGGERGMRGRLGRMRHRLCQAGHHVDVQMDEEPGVWLRSFHLLDLEEHTEDPVQEWGEEVEDGAIYGITLHREPIQPVPDAAGSDCVNGFMQYRTLKVRRIKAAPLERLVTELVNPECPDPDYMQIFLSTYRAFTDTNTLVKLLFRREDVDTNLDKSVRVRSTLPRLIRLWLDEYHEDLRDPPDHQALRLLGVHLRHRLCFRRLAHQAEALLKAFKTEDTQTGDGASSSVCAPSVVKPTTEETVETQDTEEMGNVLEFPTQDIAEQLTMLDAELFVKVVPFHCLGCIWSQRDKKENRDLAPTVRATISQFNAVTNCVITSLLCPPATSAPSSLSSPQSSPTQRAKIIEMWISVAQECRQLKNFSSLRAILSALQSNAVYRLKKTWAAISRESVAVFDNLCETFPDENCVLTNREIFVEEGNQAAEVDTVPPKPSPASKQMTSTSGEVPYLGTYLTVLTMLDTALSDNIEGLINFEKRRKEFEILSQIRQLQASCAHYTLQTHPHIGAWINSGIPLSDQKSYELSRELEPPVDPSPSSPNPWSHRLFSKKLTSLLSGGENLSKKSLGDQISVSSSGSSGSEMEDLSSPNMSPLRYKGQSPSVSCQDISEDTPPSSRTPPASFRGSLHGDLSEMNCESPSPTSSASSSSSILSSSSSSSSPLQQQAVPHPLYNKQVADSCIVRVSVEFGNNGNMYKSILITSQDKMAHVIQRALEKHNLEDMNCQDFTLTQVLSDDKELLIPEKANVFYAMCTTSNYDFVLRQRYKNHRRTQSSTWSLRGHK